MTNYTQLLSVCFSFLVLFKANFTLGSSQTVQSIFYKKVFLFTGYPGSGKGTQGKIIAQKLGIIHLSTGELYRAEVKTGSEVGRQMDVFMKKGQIIPKELTFDYLRRELKKSKYQKGIILDGYPKNKESYDFIFTCLEELGFEVPGVFYFDISREKVTERLCGRLLCKDCEKNYHKVFLPPKEEGVCDHCNENLSYRSDDTVEAIAKRLDSYEFNTFPLLGLYKKIKILHRIPADGTIDQISRVIAVLMIQLSKNKGEL